MAIIAAAFLAAILTGCGVGKATNQEKISKTATTYLPASPPATPQRPVPS